MNVHLDVLIEAPPAPAGERLTGWRRKQQPDECLDVQPIVAQ